MAPEIKNVDIENFRLPVSQKSLTELSTTREEFLFQYDVRSSVRGVNSLFENKKIPEKIPLTSNIYNVNTNLGPIIDRAIKALAAFNSTQNPRGPQPPPIPPPEGPGGPQGPAPGGGPPPPDIGPEGPGGPPGDTSDKEDEESSSTTIPSTSTEIDTIPSSQKELIPDKQVPQDAENLKRALIDFQNALIQGKRKLDTTDISILQEANESGDLTSLNKKICYADRNPLLASIVNNNVASRTTYLTTKLYGSNSNEIINHINDQMNIYANNLQIEASKELDEAQDDNIRLKKENFYKLGDDFRISLKLDELERKYKNDFQDLKRQFDELKNKVEILFKNNPTKLSMVKAIVENVDKNIESLSNSSSNYYANENYPIQDYFFSEAAKNGFYTLLPILDSTKDYGVMAGLYGIMTIVQGINLLGGLIQNSIQEYNIPYEDDSFMEANSDIFFYVNKTMDYLQNNLAVYMPTSFSKTNNLFSGINLSPNNIIRNYSLDTISRIVNAIANAKKYILNYSGFVEQLRNFQIISGSLQDKECRNDLLTFLNTSDMTDFTNISNQVLKLKNIIPKESFNVDQLKEYTMDISNKDIYKNIDMAYNFMNQTLSLIQGINNIKDSPRINTSKKSLQDLEKKSNYVQTIEYSNLDVVKNYAEFNISSNLEKNAFPVALHVFYLGGTEDDLKNYGLDDDNIVLNKDLFKNLNTYNGVINKLKLFNNNPKLNNCNELSQQKEMFISKIIQLNMDRFSKDFKKNFKEYFGNVENLNSGVDAIKEIAAPINNLVDQETRKQLMGETNHNEAMINWLSQYFKPYCNVNFPESGQTGFLTYNPNPNLQYQEPVNDLATIEDIKFYPDGHGNLITGSLLKILDSFIGETIVLDEQNLMDLFKDNRFLLDIFQKYSGQIYFEDLNFDDQSALRKYINDILDSFIQKYGDLAAKVVQKLVLLPTEQKLLIKSTKSNFFQTIYNFFLENVPSLAALGYGSNSIFNNYLQGLRNIQGRAPLRGFGLKPLPKVQKYLNFKNLQNTLNILKKDNNENSKLLCPHCNADKKLLHYVNDPKDVICNICYNKDYLTGGGKSKSFHKFEEIEDQMEVDEPVIDENKIKKLSNEILFFGDDDKWKDYFKDDLIEALMYHFKHEDETDIFKANLGSLILKFLESRTSLNNERMKQFPNQLIFENKFTLETLLNTNPEVLLNIAL